MHAATPPRRRGVRSARGDGLWISTFYDDLTETRGRRHVAVHRHRVLGVTSGEGEEKLIVVNGDEGDPGSYIVRVADALDLAQGRSRVPFEHGRPNNHSLSAVAIDSVDIRQGEEKAVTIEIAMNNSSGIFQVDELLATKLRGSGLEQHLEVIARIDAEHEKRLLPVFRIE